MKAFVVIFLFSIFSAAAQTWVRGDDTLGQLYHRYVDTTRLIGKVDLSRLRQHEDSSLSDAVIHSLRYNDKVWVIEQFGDSYKPTILSCDLSETRVYVIKWSPKNIQITLERTARENAKSVVVKLLARSPSILSSEIDNFVYKRMQQKEQERRQKEIELKYNVIEQLRVYERF